MSVFLSLFPSFPSFFSLHLSFFFCVWLADVPPPPHSGVFLLAYPNVSETSVAPFVRFLPSHNSLVLFLSCPLLLPWPFPGSPQRSDREPFFN